MSAEPLVDVSGPAAVRPGILESHGVESIPDGERTSAPRDFLWVWHSAQFSFASVVLGALPVLLGLGWWSSVTATVAGSVVGTAMMAPVAAFGIRTGTSDPESSGAHFGVRGRVIGNVITIAVAVGFFAIAVWTGGTAVMVAGSRWLGTPGGPGALAVTMPLVAVTVILIAVFGHEVLLATYKITAVIGGAVLLACVVVTWGRFDAGYAGGDYALGGFWPTWLQAAALAASLPLSYATFQGDYSRYMPTSTSPRSVVRWNAAGMAASCVASLLAGAYLTTMLADRDAPWVQALTELVPGRFVVVVVLFAVVGAFPQGGLCIYAAGLAANSILRRVPRPAVTAGVSVLAMVVLYAGTVVYDAVDSITAFLSLLLVVVGPWTAIMVVGYALRGGRYQPRELRRRGAYWFTGGVNPRAVTAFVAGSVLGFCWVAGGIYTGPLVALTGGVDLSCLVSFTAAGGLYYLLCRLFPEMRGSS